MANINELLEKRARLGNQMKDLCQRADNENRAMTADENTQWEQLNTEWDSISLEIGRLEKMRKVLSEEADKRPESVIVPASKKQEESERKERYNEVFWKYAREGEKNLSAEERNLLIAVRGTNPQITTVPGQGGYLIPEGFSNRLEARMKFFGGMLEAAMEMNTSTGNPIAWPRVDDTAVVGALLDESNPSIATEDMTFTQVMLNAYTYTSGFVMVSVQLAQDSAFNLEAFLQEQFANRLGRAINAHLTTGSGSERPYGVVNALVAAGNTTNAAASAAISRTDLINLQHAVDRAYRFNGAYMMNDTTLAAIKKLAVGSNDDRPLWQPSMREGEPDRIEGFPYFINNDLANIGAGNYSTLFGDFQKYVYRTVGSTVFLALRERFMEKLQIGFVAYKRVDGELLQPNALRALRHITT